MTEQPFDYAAWQERMRFTNPQAAAALDVSDSFFSALKRNGKGRKVYAFAAYGIECAEAQSRAGKPI